MSGAPVFIEQGANILLAGIYAGAIYTAPDRRENDRFPEIDRVTDLGTFSGFAWIFMGVLALTKNPSKPER